MTAAGRPARHDHGRSHACRGRRSTGLSTRHHFWAHLHYLAHTAPNPQQSGPRNLWDEIDTVHYW